MTAEESSSRIWWDLVNRIQKPLTEDRVLNPVNNPILYKSHYPYERNFFLEDGVYTPMSLIEVYEKVK